MTLLRQTEGSYLVKKNPEKIYLVPTVLLAILAILGVAGFSLAAIIMWFGVLTTAQLNILIAGSLATAALGLGTVRSRYTARRYRAEHYRNETIYEDKETGEIIDPSFQF